MSSYAVLLGVAVFALGFLGLRAVRQRLRLTPETLARIVLVVAVVALMAIANNLWTLHESQQITATFQGQIDALTTRAAALKERVALNRANTVATTRQDEDAIQRNDLSVLKANADKQAALSKERDQLAADGVSLGKDLDGLKVALGSARQTQSDNEFWTSLGTMASVAILALTLALNRSAQKAKADQRAARIREQGLDPMALSANVIALANDGKTIAAIAAHRAETGVDLAAAKGALEAYLAQFKP